MNYNFATRNEYLISPKGLGPGSLPCLRKYLRSEGPKFFGHRAEFEQNKGVRAEFRAE